MENTKAIKVAENLTVRMRGEASILTSAILMGTLSIFVRNIHGDALSVTFLRFSFGLAFLIAFLAIFREKPKVEDSSLVLLSIANLVTIACYIAAIQGMEVGMAALLLYMAPVYVLPIAALTGEKIERITWLAVPLGIFGLYLMLTPYSSITPAMVFGIISGIAYAFVFYFSKKAREKHSSLQITVFNLAVGTAVLFPYFLLHRIHFSIAWAAGIGFIPTAVPFVLFAYGIKYIKVQRAPILALMEPVTATIVGYLYFSEFLTLKQLIGAALILLSVSLAWRE